MSEKKEKVSGKRKKTEEELRESEEKFRTIFEIANDIIMYVDRFGKIIDINKKVEDVLGYKREDVIGKNFAKTGALSVGNLPKIVKLFLKSVRQGSVLSGGSTNIMELELRHKNGKTVSLESSTQIIKKNGKTEGFLNILRDITERKKAEEELRETELNFRKLFESSKDAMMTLAPPSWNFTSGNPSIIGMFGVKDEKEFTSLPPWELSPKYQPDGQLSSVKAKKMIMKAMKTGSNSFEWTHKRLHGDNFYATVLLTRIDLGGGNKFLQATVRDITERKTMEKGLRERTKQLEEKVYDLERFSEAGVGRELKMVELKNMIKELENKLKKHGIQTGGKKT